MKLYCYPSPVGLLFLAVSGEYLKGLWLEGQKYFPDRLPPAEDCRPPEPFCSWLDRYFSGCCPDPRELKLQPEGSEFRQQVWQQLLQIPYGETVTYAALAKQLAAQRGLASMSAQAIGGAVGHNPISIIIPCHRVVGTDGSLTGYAGGLDRKQWLLNHEKSSPKGAQQ